MSMSLSSMKTKQVANGTTRLFIVSTVEEQ